MSKTYCVYKYEYDGEVIYVGKNSTKIKNRVHQHSMEESFAPYIDKAKIFYAEYEHPIEADVMEKLLVAKYKPYLNKILCLYEQTIMFEEPEWIQFYSEPKKDHLFNSVDSFLQSCTKGTRILRTSLYSEYIRYCIDNQISCIPTRYMFYKTVRNQSSVPIIETGARGMRYFKILQEGICDI